MFIVKLLVKLAISHQRRLEATNPNLLFAQGIPQKSQKVKKIQKVKQHLPHRFPFFGWTFRPFSPPPSTRHHLRRHRPFTHHALGEIDDSPGGRVTKHPKGAQTNEVRFTWVAGFPGSSWVPHGFPIYGWFHGTSMENPWFSEYQKWIRNHKLIKQIQLWGDVWR